MSAVTLDEGIADAGFEPTSIGYEPIKEPLLQSASIRLLVSQLHIFALCLKSPSVLLVSGSTIKIR